MIEKIQFKSLSILMKNIIILFLLICFSITLNAGIYVSPTGDDNNAGTIELPFKTIPKAVTVAVGGDTIYIREGTHTYSTNISISKIGTATSKYYLFAYNDERPLIDFSTQDLGVRGISLNGSYWHVKGLDIKGSGDNGMFIKGSNNIVEFCSFFENKDTGLQIGNGASNNRVINCDSYYNADPSEGNADGFAPKLDVGTGNYFYGCRAWQNSDDGYDGYLRPSNDITTTYENCWAFKNGYRKNGTASSGNGNGFKMGGSDDKTLMHNIVLTNCFAFENRVKGFDQNNNKGSMTLNNCTAHLNGTNYSISAALNTGKVLIIINCAVLGLTGSIGSFAVQQTNSWMPQFSVTANDFLSIIPTEAYGPRKADGSLPDITYMNLAEGSQLINAGTDIGLAFYGSAPDLGCFESNYPNSVDDEEVIPAIFMLSQNYPNPFNPTTKISFSVHKTEYTTFKIYNILGQEVATLFADIAEVGRKYVVEFSAGGGLSSGIYFYTLKNNLKTETKKLLLTR